MTTPVTAGSPVALDAPASPTDAPPPDLFAALLSATCAPLALAPDLPTTGTPGSTVTADAAVAATTAWSTATAPAVPGLATAPAMPAVAASPAVPTAPSTPGPVRAEQPEHPLHPAHPLHPSHPVHPLHPLHAAVVPTDEAAPVDAVLPVVAAPAPTAPTVDAPATDPTVAPVDATAATATPVTERFELPADPVATTPPVQALPTPAAAPTAVPPTVDAGEPTAAVTPAVATAAKRLRHEGDRTSLVVRLDPPELGAVLVRMTVRDGQVDVSLRAPDLVAQGSLQQQAPDIAAVLRDAGLDLSSFDVSYGDLLQQGHPDESRQTPDRGTPRRQGTADGSVHVTDDVPDPRPAGTFL